jgi:hypothetical protein
MVKYGNEGNPKIVVSGQWSVASQKLSSLALALTTGFGFPIAKEHPHDK